MAVKVFQTVCMVCKKNYISFVEFSHLVPHAVINLNFFKIYNKFCKAKCKVMSEGLVNFGILIAQEGLFKFMIQ